MSKVLISSGLIEKQIHDLESEMCKYQGSYLALKIIKEKIDTLDSFYLYFQKKIQ